MPPPLDVTDGVIAFDGVEFGYDPRRPILRDVSFDVPSGNTVAIVGASGAGKSTISRLLFRFYDVRMAGAMTDRRAGHPRGHPGFPAPGDRRRAAGHGVVQRHGLLQHRLWPARCATPAEVEEAARLARIHDFVIATPDGYQTMVGERGLKLSGGEKQRVAIARAILKRPRILLFDEATSALDSRTEKEIQASLREVSADRTTLVIAHRLSTVVDADEIIVLDDGAIVERGRHGDLLAKEGRYAEMWRRQQEVAELEETLGEKFAEAVSAAD